MRAIFLDRDGVICKNRADHVKSWQEFRFLPQAKEALVALSNLGLPIVVITNQAIINRGMAPVGVVEYIHERMVAEITACGGRIDRIIYCPHRPEDRCDCRKPKPGMLLQADQEMDIDLTHSYFVGDAATDLMAARQVGCRAFLVLTGRGVQQLIPALRSMSGQFTLTLNLMGAALHIRKAELQIVEKNKEEVIIPSSTGNYSWVHAAPEK